MKVKRVIALCVWIVLVGCSCSNSFVPYKGYVVDVDSSDFTIVLLDNNELWGWGYNLFYGLGYIDGNHYVNKPVHLADDVMSFTVGESATLFIKSDNSLWGLGLLELAPDIPSDYYIDGYALKPIKLMDHAKGVFTGGLNYFVITTEDALYGCGKNFDGSLGTGDEVEQTKFVKIMEDVKSVSANSNRTTFILKTDNTLWGVGSNANGQLLDFDGEMSLEPVYMMDNVQSVYQNGFSNSYAIKTDHTLWTWGRNFYFGLVEDSTGLTKITDDVSDVGEFNGGVGILKQDATLSYVELELSTYSLTQNKFAYHPVLMEEHVVAFSAGVHGDYILKDDGTLLGINGAGTNEGNLFSLEGMPTDVTEPVIIMQP